MPLVTAEFVLDGGAAAEPAGKAGVARLTAQALETGTRTRTAEQVAWELEHLGVELESRVTWDAALLSITVARERLDPAFALLTELLLEPGFPAPEVERLRQEQIAAILKRGKEPGALANDMALRFIYAPSSRYAQPLLGTRASLEDVGPPDLEAFYRSRYRAGSAALVLAGDIDAAGAERLAARYLGHWSAGPPPALELEVCPATTRTTIFVVDRPGSVQSEIRIGRIGVERRHPDYFTLQVLNALLGGMFTSRLNLCLREKHGITYSARSRFAFRRGAGPFLIDVAVATPSTGLAVREILRELSVLCQETPGELEVAAARDYLAGVFPLELLTAEQMAEHVAELVIFDLPDDYLQHYRAHIAAVQPSEVHRAAAQHLHAPGLAIVIVGDAAAVATGLEELGAGPVEIVQTD
ncbi:MAG: insulinase family protein [Gemmatimonadetes bacterium]|nr:insulinase family protein [Gemmatimonadota bacterium]